MCKGDEAVWAAITEIHGQSKESELEAKALAYTREEFLKAEMDAIRTLSGQNYRQLQRSAQAVEARLQQEMRDVRLRHDEVALGFRENIKRLEKLVRLEVSVLDSEA